MRRLVLVAGACGLLAGAFGALAQADPGAHSSLTAISGQGSGFVEVAPTAKNEDSFTFDAQITVNIHGTAPNTDFTVSRLPDFNPNGICTGSAWLPLSPVLTTSAGGAGAAHFENQRGAPLLDEDVTFDVMFRAVGTDGTVLMSECFTVTVK